MEKTQARKRPVELDFDAEDEDQYYVTRPHTSARRYNIPPQRDTLDDPLIQKGPVIQRRRSMTNPDTGSGMASKAFAPSRRQEARPAGMFVRAHRFPLMAIILGMIIMAIMAFAFSALGAWWQVHQDDATYGRPRTFQVDAVVGHNDSPSNPTHFTFINLNRHVIIIELPGGDPSHARIYSGPTLFGDGQDLTPITAEFRDVNSDGKPDMIIHIQDQRLVYINDGTQFRPQQPGERVNL